MNLSESRLYDCAGPGCGSQVLGVGALSVKSIRGYRMFCSEPCFHARHDRPLYEGRIPWQPKEL